MVLAQACDGACGFPVLHAAVIDLYQDMYDSCMPHRLGCNHGSTYDMVGYHIDYNTIALPM